MEPLTVLIADDHQLFRDGVRALVNAQPGMKCIGEAANGEDTVRLANELQPDVVLLDIQMPGMSGIEATSRIVAASPQIRILIVTMFEDDHLVFAAMRAGARGYFLKGARHMDMVRAIRAVGNGEVIFGSAIAARIVEYFTASQPIHPPEIFPELSSREREVLALLVQGCKNTEIAERLVISDKTVRNYVSNIINKLQVTDRTQAILRAQNAKLKP